MSEDRPQLFARGEEFLALFTRGAEFTRELLRENERLRSRLAQIQDQQESAAQNPDDWEKLRQDLLLRIQSLEDEYSTVRERLRLVEQENHHFATRYLEIEEENNNLANLYVASYQLHSTLDVEEVVKIIIEIVINLIGAEVFAIYMLDGNGLDLGVVASEGAETAELPVFTLGSGPFGEAVERATATCWEDPDSSQPMVCIPLRVQSRTIGAIAIFRLLQQKEGFSALDHELFNVLAGHAATALFAARLYSQSKRKLNTIQGFIDLLTD